jgi:hypothetical protein
MNLQENIYRIKSIMGIYEQKTLPPTRCDQWKNGTFVNGDGITTPKITITKTPTLIEGLYEGPDSGGCIQRGDVNNNDTPHQLAGITVFYEAAPYLKELYKNGTYVKPDMPNIKMERIQNKMFKISIPLIPTTEDKAITNMNERGGMLHGGDLTEIKKIQNDPNYILKELVKKTADDITETFICFRNIVDFPIKTVTSKTTTGQQPTPTTSQSTTKEFEITKKYLNNTKSDDTKSDSLYPEFIKQVRDYIINNGNKNYIADDFDLSSKDGINVTAKLRIVPNEKGFNKFSILFNAVGQSPVTLNYALEKNAGFIENIENGTIVKDNEIDPEYEWHLVGLHV